MLSVVVLAVCSAQIVQAVDKAKKGQKKLTEVEERIHYLTSKHSFSSRFRRSIDNKQELVDIHAFADKFQTKVDAFQTAIDNCHPSHNELKQELQALHTKALLPIPNIMRRFFVGRIVDGTNLIKPTSYASTYSLVQLFEPKSPDLSLFHKQLVDAGNTYKRRLKKSYSAHNQSPQGDMPDQVERGILYKEYTETIVPFIGCFGVLADMHKRKPEAVEQAAFIWDQLLPRL